MLKVFLFLSLTLNFLFGFYLLRPPSSSETYSVNRIIDGDTFVLTSQQQIRLQNANAPELNLCGGQPAKSKLESLLTNQTVRLIGDTTDKFGRRIALVYVGDTLINEQMLLSGWAKFISAASGENNRLKSAGEVARSQKLGVYSPLCRQSINPLNPKCSIKANHGERENIYSFPGCGSYDNTIVELDEGDAWFCAETEAQAAGFTKAANCHQKTFSFN